MREGKNPIYLLRLGFGDSDLGINDLGFDVPEPGVLGFGVLGLGAL